MTKRIDYDRAFAPWKVLRSVERHTALLKLEHPDYRIAAASPFLVYPNGNLYTEEVVEPSLVAYWRITDQFLLESEVETLAWGALEHRINPDVLSAIDTRCRAFFPWLTLIKKAADRKVLKHLKQNHLLN